MPERRIWISLDRAVAGKFILTYDDSPFIRELYDECQIDEISRKKGINSRSSKGHMDMKQLVIMG